MGTIHCHVSVDEVEVWGKIQVVDGDTIVASSLVRSSQEDSRNASYVRVSFVYIFHLPTFNLLYSKYQLLVDKNAQLANTEPLFIPETFYGQLQHIFIINMPAAQQLGIPKPEILILGTILTCNIEEQNDPDMHYYKTHGRTEVVDITTVQCLVDHVKNCGSWAIIDRSGNLARATFELD